MRHLRLALLTTMLIVVSCKPHRATLDLQSASYPVLLGPVERIGGPPGEWRAAEKIADMDGTASWQYMNFVALHKRIWVTDSITNLLVGAATENRIARIRHIRAGYLGHITGVGFVTRFVDVEAELHELE